MDYAKFPYNHNFNIYKDEIRLSGTYASVTWRTLTAGTWAGVLPVKYRRLDQYTMYKVHPKRSVAFYYKTDIGTFVSMLDTASE
jgi:hypothetical protein